VAAFGAAAVALLAVDGAQATSAGCTSLNGLSATDPVGGPSSFIIQTRNLEAGDKLTFTTAGGGGGTTTNVIITKQPGGNVFNDTFNGNGSNMFTITQDGNYLVTVTITSAGTAATTTITCGGTAAGGGANGFAPNPGQKANIANSLLNSIFAAPGVSFSPLDLDFAAREGHSALRVLTRQLRFLRLGLLSVNRGLKKSKARLRRKKAELKKLYDARRFAWRLGLETNPQAREQIRILEDQIQYLEGSIPALRTSRARYRAKIKETLKEIEATQDRLQDSRNAGGSNFLPFSRSDSSPPATISHQGGHKRLYVDIDALMASPNKGDRLWLNGGGPRRNGGSRRAMWTRAGSVPVRSFAGPTTPAKKASPR